MKINLHETINSELARISELSQRTNRCTNGVRYTVEKLNELVLKHEYKLLSIFLCDCFSNYGLVGVIGIEGNKLDLFCLSCRALGRRIEREMIERAIKEGAKSVKVHKTGKNEELVQLFSMFGLECEIEGVAEDIKT